MNRVQKRLVKELMMHSWDLRFMEMAELVASWSKDPRTKVGCVLADSKHRVLGVGYNGFPRGVDDRSDRYANREVKLAMVKHAEENAVFNAAKHDLSDAVAYVTLAPCSSCAGTLIQAGVRRVVFPEPDLEHMARHYGNYELMLQMLKEARVLKSVITKEGVIK